MVVVEVIMENEPSALKIISVKPHSNLVLLFALEVLSGFLIFHLPTTSVGFSSS